MPGDVETPNPQKLITATPTPFPTSATGFNLNKSIRGFRFLEDEEGFMYAIPVVPIDPQGDASRPQLIRGISPIDGVEGLVSPPIGAFVYGAEMLYHPDSGTYCPQRTPTVFWEQHDQTATVVLITTGATETFRLLSGCVTLSKDAACAGTLTIYVQDGATTIMAWTISHGALVAMGQVVNLPFIIPFNGYLSAAVGNDLTVAVVGNLTAGSFSAYAAGCIE